MGINWICSPGFAHTGGSCFLSKKGIGLLPIICHPPGLCIGYIPVYLPPMATDPGGTAEVGILFLGK